VGELGAIDFGEVEEVLPVFALGLAQRWLRLHVDGFVAGVALAFYRADVDADGATGAVFRSDLESVVVVLHALPLGLSPLEGCRGFIAEFGRVDLGADDGVRADHDALAALDAEVLIPDGDELRDVALLPLRGACGEGAARGNCADGELVAAAGGDF